MQRTVYLGSLAAAFGFAMVLLTAIIPWVRSTLDPLADCTLQSWPHTLMVNLRLAVISTPLLWGLLLWVRRKRLDSIDQLLARSREVEAENNLATSVFSVALEAIVVMDAKTHVLSVNPAFTEITGYTADDVVGRRSSVLQGGLEDQDFYAAMWGNIRLLDQWQGQLWRRRKNGEPFLTWQSVRMLRDENGAVSRYITVFSDITDLHHKNEQLRHQALHDALTGLPNRSLLLDRLDHAIELARRDGQRVALLFIDLDHFKEVNDTLGHDVGDQLLRIVTQRLQKGLRQSDTVARLGGDEFVVAIANIENTAEVETVAEILLGLLMEPVELAERILRIGASIGGAIFPDDADGSGSLMRKADEAMYRAKTAGGNCFCLFEEGHDTGEKRYLGIETGLRRALEHGEFEVHFQPRIDLSTGAMFGAEALLRWNCPSRGLVLPEQFIAQAEQCGMIHDLGDWVLKSVCNQMVNWRVRGFPALPIAVNLSGLQLSPALVDQIRMLLASHALSPSQLEIDVSGSTLAFHEDEQAVQALLQLRQMGVTIAIDDFGNSSLYLQDLARVPLDLIKINRSFVRDVDYDSHHAMIVEAIISMANSMGLVVIAEGVETDAEECFLRRVGCDYVQGFKYARPLPADKFEHWFVGVSIEV